MVKILSIGILLLTLGFSVSPFMKSSPPDPLPAPGPEKKTVSDDFLAFADFFQEKLDECHCPGASVAIVRDTQEIFLKGFGVKSVGKTTPVSAHSVFRIGSLSKGFASVLTGIMADKGYIRWDDRVKQYVPDFELHSPKQGNRITIEHILSHTTGLPIHSYTNLVEHGKSVRTIMEELPKVKLLGEEGKIYAYQNAAYSIIEEVLHAATKKSFGDLLQERIFEPLEMSQSSSSYDIMISENDMASPHRYRSKNDVFTPTSISKKYYNSKSSGGINSSAADMAKWMSLLMGFHPDIIGTEALDKVFQPFIRTSHASRYFNGWEGVKNSYYAFGWRVVDFDARRIICHGGYVNGYRSEIAVDRKNGIGICVLFNGPCKYAKNVVPDFFGHLDSLEAIQSLLSPNGPSSPPDSSGRLR